MTLQYTNQKGETYYLHKRTGKKGGSPAGEERNSEERNLKVAATSSLIFYLLRIPFQISSNSLLETFQV